MESLSNPCAFARCITGELHENKHERMWSSTQLTLCQTAEFLYHTISYIADICI